MRKHLIKVLADSLLPNPPTTSTSSRPGDDEPCDVGSGGHAADHPNPEPGDPEPGDPDSVDPDCADQGCADPEDAGHGGADPGRGGDPEHQARYDDADADDGVDEATDGADPTAIIHATGAELRALINGEVGTGGTAERLGPIPQTSLRKHLIKALAQTLLPNLPTTPTRTHHGGATVRRARTRSRVDIRVTDEPPPSDPDSYTPSAALDRWVRLRDRVCQFAGCNRPAEFTDVDHRVAFAAGGRTTADNLWCLCRHHHRLKHEGGWGIEPNPDGSHTWISPTGRRYRDNSPDTDHGP